MNSLCFVFARRPAERVDAIVYDGSTAGTGPGSSAAIDVGITVPSGDPALHATILPLLKPIQS